MNQRKHQGFDTPSYLLKNLKTGTLTTRNKRDIRKFAGDEGVVTENAYEAPESINNIITGIMKAPKYAESGPDNAGPSQPGRDIESRTPDIKEPQEPDTSVVSSTVLPLTVHWSKAIEVIYFDEPQVQSTYSLHQYFAS